MTAGSQTLSVTFTPTDTTDYTTATATVTLVVNQATQTITFIAPTSPVTYGVPPITLSATASSGLPVTISVLSGPASISGNILTITGVGTVVVAADQAGDADYAAAREVTHRIVVKQIEQTISFSTHVASDLRCRTNHFVGNGQFRFASHLQRSLRSCFDQRQHSDDYGSRHGGGGCGPDGRRRLRSSKRGNAQNCCQAVVAASMPVSFHQ